MSLKITTLIENMADDSGKLFFEHGFSVWIELDGKKMLFDTGQSGDFVKNAKLLGLDTADVDAVILSHGHYDHTGGVPELLRGMKKKIPIYIGKEFFNPKYKLLEDGSYKYNGNPFEKECLCAQNSPVEVHYVEKDITEVSERLFLFKNFARVTDYEKVNPKFFVKGEKDYVQDLFPEEIALGIMTEQGLVLVVGCSHVGIINILEHVKKTTGMAVAAVLGGTHLVEAGEERLTETIEAMKSYGVRTIAVSHCTGEVGMERLRKEFSEGFVRNNTGNVMEFLDKMHCETGQIMV